MRKRQLVAKPESMPTEVQSKLEKWNGGLTQKMQSRISQHRRVMCWSLTRSRAATGGLISVTDL